MSRKEQTSILIIYTGGTIGMIHNSDTGALESFNFDHLLSQVPELKQFNIGIDAITFDPPIDSSDMEPELWGRIVAIIERNYDKYDGFVILHGTDTMCPSCSADRQDQEGCQPGIFLLHYGSGRREDRHG